MQTYETVPEDLSSYWQRRHIVMVLYSYNTKNFVSDSYCYQPGVQGCITLL